MGMKELKEEISEEVSTILASDFQVEVVETDTVPHSSDGAITFPNLDAKRQGTKLIDTCVLYIDIRRSTQLNFTHKPKTVAKLYSAFVRAMTRCARHNDGHVRGIIGDRVMVIFDRKDCFRNAVECAITMNSVATYVINKHFRNGEVTCGIGIDTGKMLATKTGIRRKGSEQSNYRNLVWLGRPANIASKLTDLANKPEDSFTYTKVNVSFMPVSGGPGILSGDWGYREISAGDFVSQLDVELHTGKLVHRDPAFLDMFTIERTFVRTPKTHAILMTEAVWNGYKAACPTSNVVTEPLFHPITLELPAYTGKVYGGNVIKTVFKE